ncbi:MAG: helix-turn-helix transcriptional regulator [Myxococcales bacterium]|nr:helix-turn-helix transcriptional regulator [Myxococcales bacterium]MCB9540276.1 helix-turn-helix transcriptional regulator [Myxococcales bacterium]
MKQFRTFGDIVLRRRKELKLTQSELAGRIGCQPNYIVYLEKGERRPSDRTVRKVADALGVDRGELYLAANPQVREFLHVDDDNTVLRDELPDGLAALTEDGDLRAALHITDEEIDVVSGVRLEGRVTTARQYASLILMMRYVFA